MGILDGKKIVITGVLTDASLAFGIAKLAQEEGAEIVLTGAGRGLRLTQRTARKLPNECDVYEFDVTDAPTFSPFTMNSPPNGAALTAPCTPSGSRLRCAWVKTSWLRPGTT